jgi:hypothetical protein
MGEIRSSLDRQQGRLPATMALTLLALELPYTPPAVPPPGARVDQRFEIALPASVEEPVVRIGLRGTEIAIPRTLLATLASQAPASWKTEAERQAVIWGRPAEALLRAADSAPVGPLDGGRLDREVWSLVSTILQAGRACVHRDGAVTPVRSLVVHYSGFSAGPMMGMGDISVDLVEPRLHLFSSSWFVR